MFQPYLKIIEPKFRQLVLGNCHLEKLWTGSRWAEGPVYFGAHRALVFSDIPNDRMMRFDECSGTVSVFREPSLNSNGNTRDREGRMISCEHRGRRVSRTEPDGTVITIADSWNGKRFNSPNDAVVASDGAIWFTDPAYGIDGDYEGDKAESAIGACHVYRIDPNGTVEAVATDFVRPNGIAFSPDESLLYVADTGATHQEGGPQHIRRFKVNGKTISGGEVFATCDYGLFDGFRLDMHGNVWSSAGDGVHCFAPDGTLLGKILVPEVVANVCFGGRKRNRLYICGTTSLYATYLGTTGAPYPG